VKIYKILAAGRKSCFGGDMTWEPGQWYEVTGDLVPCRNGFHLCREQDLLDWLQEEIWEAEYEGEVIDHGNKLVVRKARITKQCAGWNERSARLFAVDCAQDVAHLIPGPEAQECIEVARAYASQEASWSDAVYDAAQETALAAALAAEAAGDAGPAARAARDAAWKAARERQTRMLKVLVSRCL